MRPYRWSGLRKDHVEDELIYRSGVYLTDAERERIAR
jgi:hypothetical protein